MGGKVFIDTFKTPLEAAEHFGHQWALAEEQFYVYQENRSGRYFGSRQCPDVVNASNPDYAALVGTWRNDNQGLINCSLTATCGKFCS